MSLHYYHAGEAYDLAPELAEYLVAEGFASIEMRQHDLRVVVDMKSEFYMQGSVIDFNDSLMERGFKFKNPTASGTCGCGSSFSI